MPLTTPADLTTKSPAGGLRPVEEPFRIAALDVIRGFALLGVFAENIQRYVAQPSDPVNLLAARFVRYALQGNFYPVYSFLFGVGITLQLQASWARDRRPVWLHLRRMGALLLVGLGFFIFLDPNLVLINYALLGIGLVSLRRLAPRSVLAVGLAILALAAIYPFLETPLLGLRGSDRATQVATTLGAETARISADIEAGSYRDVVADAIGFLAWHWRVPSFYRWWGHILAMLVLGMWACRQGIFTHTSEHLRFLRRCVWVTLPVAIASSLLGNLSERPVVPALGMPWSHNLRIAILTLGSSAAAFLFVAALTLMVRRERWARVLHVLTYPGRLSLTNFVAQSVVMTGAFYGFGLHLNGKIDVVESLLAVAIVYAAQTWLSALWLRRFRIGPLEWLWRVLAYGTRLPIRI